MFKKKGLLAAAGVAALVLAASMLTSTSATAAANCDPFAGYKSMKGKTVTIFTSILEPELTTLQSAWSDFTKCTGVNIKIEGSNQFEALLPVRVKGNNAPDLAFIPQPGLLAKLVETGKVKRAPKAVVKNVDTYWSPSWKAYGTVKGKFYAAPFGSNMKSFVWYSPKQFKENGYTVPKTWDEMTALADKMAGNDQIAFCGGLGSGGATGWPGTDWVEQMVLREYGSKVYADWVSHKVKFSDPKIKAAMQKVADWMQNPKWVGDVKAIATTSFQDAGAGIPEGKCMMLQQASFYGNILADNGATISPTGDAFAFYLPATNDNVTVPVVGGGEFTAAFSSRREVKAVQAYLASATFATSRVQLDNWLSANSGVPLSAYKNPVDKLAATYLANPKSTFAFDASDLMPAAVGAGAEWVEFTAWFGEGKSIADVTKAIDAAWPAD
ncbi:MAG: extracellular solute-binding protein [Candidatus Planktophila sp.]|jgi:alpha-glucoside transport system substrate-binding protein